MLDFLSKNRELAGAVASVVVAVLGVVTALLKRNTSHTVRHETVIDAPPALVGGNRSRRGAALPGVLTPGVSVAGDFLCVQNESIHRSQVLGVTLGRGVNGIVALVAVPLLGFLALGAWGGGDYGVAVGLGVAAFIGATAASMKDVYLVTPQGPRRAARSLFAGEANRLRDEILTWRSG
jgi:hypothetical protein